MISRFARFQRLSTSIGRFSELAAHVEGMRHSEKYRHPRRRCCISWISASLAIRVDRCVAEPLLTARRHSASGRPDAENRAPTTPEKRMPKPAAS